MPKSEKSDIRKFFGAKSAPSALSTIKKAAQSESPKKQEKTKKRPEKVETSRRQPVADFPMDSDDDGESPLPSSVKKETHKGTGAKRRAKIQSDSDDDIPKPRAKTSKVTSASPSPAKATRKSKVRIVSDEDTPKKKESVALSDNDSDDQQSVNESGGKESVEVKSKQKRGLLAGQRKLELSQETKQPHVTSKGSKSEPALKKVNPSDFFGGSQTDQPTQKKSTHKEKEKASPTLAKKKVENEKPQHAKEKNDEFDPEDEAPFLKHKKTVSPKKEKEATKKESKAEAPKRHKTVSPKKEKEATKTRDFDNEFVESDDEPMPKQAKKSPSSKENVPQKAKAATPVKASSPVKQTKQSLKKDAPKPKSPLKASSASIKMEAHPVSKSDVQYELPWVDKYKPKTISQLVGQHGEKSPMNKLLGWLKDWARHNLGEGRNVKKPKPAPWQTGGDGSAFKAALLSGSPGVGKTTCAYLACESLGLKFVEMNASDVRNKKHLEAQVAQLTDSHQIDEYFGRGLKENHDDTKIHHVLIMDEVDGMSGNEDRAGISELIQIIKDTRIPIICICNDRSHPKMRSLVNYCFDLRFPKPRVEQIRARMMTIASQEKVKIGKEELDELIELSGHDVRQTIYNLQMRGSAVDSKVEQKDCAINTFEAARRLLDTRTTLMEKQEMFFTDYGIMPLFVQENYLNMKNKTHTKQQAMKAIRRASDFISLGDTVDRCIRSSGSWKLLNEQAMLSAALPAIAVDGHMSAMIQFPSWLGKNSTAGKRQRLMRQLASHAHLKLSADTHSLVTDYVPVLRTALTRPLFSNDDEGIKSVVNTMTEYDLLKDDAEAIGELAVWPGKIDPASKIPSAMKAKLTRALNKSHRMLPYHLDDVAKGRKKAADAIEVEVDEDGNLIERGAEDETEEDEEGQESNSASSSSTASTTSASRGRGGSRGGRGGTRGGGTRGTRGKK